MNEFEYLATKKDKYTFEDLCLLADLLRREGGCPWDREQTHKSIRNDIIEETYEVIEALDNGDPTLMKEELGDLLWQVVFHAQLEREEGRADMSDIIHDICSKLVHRHPHVFGNVVAETSDVVLSNWEKIKTEEKHRDTVTSKLKSVPPALPALMRAQKVGKRAPFFDFANADEVFVKLDEEIGELKDAVACRFSLLLVGFCSNDSGVLELEEEGTHALVLSNSSVIDIRRVGREEEHHLLHLHRFERRIHPLDRSLYLRGEREVVHR